MPPLMSQPKVLLFTETYFPVVGGGETQAKSLAQGLSAMGIQVTVLTRRSHAELKKVEQYGSVTVHRLPPTGPQHLKKWGLILSSLPVLFRLRKQYDVLFVSGFRIIGIPAVLAGKVLGKVCVLKADSPGEMSGEFFNVGLEKSGIKPDSALFRAFLSLRNHLLRRADAFVAISTDLAQELVDNGVKPGKIHKIPNSVDIERFHPVERQEQQQLRARLGLPQEGKIVIYTGRLVSYKGLPLLMRVWWEIQAEHSDATLVLVGSGGLDIENCEAELREFVVENNLQERVIFTGAVQNVQEYLQAADIFVFPTEKEAFGISVIEAMACGLPVIATQIGGIKGIICHDQDGLLIESGSYRQLREALELLVENPPHALKLGTEALRTARMRYATRHIVDAYTDLFDQARLELRKIG
jgi:glycosyltransferase involved in cell wall biosynthesis